MTDASPTDVTVTPDGTTPTAGANDTSQPTVPPVDDLPDWAKDPKTAAKMVAELRAENANARTQAKEKAAADAREALLKELGLKKDDEPADPAALARDLQAKDATIRDLQIKGALSDALNSAGAKPLARAAILGEGLLNNLDPAAPDFASQVSSLVAEYVTKNPELKVAQAASTSGLDIPGGSGTATVYTRAQLRDHAFYQANKAAIDQALRDGRIV